MSVSILCLFPLRAMLWFPLPNAGPLLDTGKSLVSTLDGVEIQGTLDTGRESRMGSDMISESQGLVSCAKKVVLREPGGAETSGSHCG